MQASQNTEPKSSHNVLSPSFPNSDVSPIPDQTVRVTETQRDRDTETQRDGVTENQRNRGNGDTHETEETQETEEIPLSAKVLSIQEAAKISLEAGMTPDCLFVFARALKAFETCTKVKLKALDLDSAFGVWWGMAKSILPADSDYDEYRFSFLDVFSKARTALGANVIDIATKRAKQQPLPPEALQYKNPKIQHLIAVCWQLQAIAGNESFFLSTRNAAQILGTKSLRAALAILNGLATDEILKVAERGSPGDPRKKGRATRFRFVKEKEVITPRPPTKSDIEKFVEKFVRESYPALPKEYHDSFASEWWGLYGETDTVDWTKRLWNLHLCQWLMVKKDTIGRPE